MQGDGAPAERLLWQAKLWSVQLAARALLPPPGGNPLGIQTRVKSLRSSYTGLYPQKLHHSSRRCHGKTPSHFLPWQAKLWRVQMAALLPPPGGSTQGPFRVIPLGPFQGYSMVARHLLDSTLVFSSGKASHALERSAGCPRPPASSWWEPHHSSSSLLLSGQELSDTKVYEP